MCTIIAEAGVNHNGNEKTAFQLIDAAKFAEADIVKFQTFKASKNVTLSAPKAAYQIAATGGSETQLQMLQRLELSQSITKRLALYCDEIGIEFLSTAFDSDSLKFLINDVGLKRLKIPSGELVNAPLILEHARLSLPLIISTGMATLGDIEAALGVVAFGLISERNAMPSIAAFKEAYACKEGQLALREKVTLLHCTTEYPAPIEDVNLNAMKGMASSFSLPVGYSDHTEGILVSLAAAAMGASVVEKHFTLSRLMQGPDHSASIEPEELCNLVSSIRSIESSFGSSTKFPAKSEMKNISIARKILVCTRDIKKGEVFSASNIGVRRAGTGISPFDYWRLLGEKSSQNYKSGETLNE